MSSPGYEEGLCYDNNQQCRIAVNNALAGPIRVENFSTEVSCLKWEVVFVFGSLVGRVFFGYFLKRTIEVKDWRCFEELFDFSCSSP